MGSATPRRARCRITTTSGLYQFIDALAAVARLHLGNRLGEAGHIPTIHGHLWIPIDDTSTMVWNWIYSFDPAQPLTAEWAEWWEDYSGRAAHHFIPGTYRLKLNRRTTTGSIGSCRRPVLHGIEGANTQDFAVQEGMGTASAIVRREHLGTTDRAVIAARQLLLEACDDVAEGRDPRGTDPAIYREARAADNLIPRKRRLADRARDRADRALLSAQLRRPVRLRSAPEQLVRHVELVEDLPDRVVDDVLDRFRPGVGPRDGREDDRAGFGGAREVAQVVDVQRRLAHDEHEPDGVPSSRRRRRGRAGCR